MAGASVTMKLALHMLILSITASHQVLAAAQQHTINVQLLLSSAARLAPQHLQLQVITLPHVITYQKKSLIVLVAGLLSND